MSTEQGWQRNAWLLPSAVLFAWLALLAFLIPYYRDEAVYMIAAVDVVEGHWPYTHLFINRQPLVFLAYLPSGLSGSIELERLVAALAVVASVPAFLALARKWLSGRQILLAVISYCLLISNPFMIRGANNEAFLLLPLIAAVIVPSAVVAGVLIGTAVMLKLTVLPLAAAILLIRRTDLWTSVITAIGVGLALTIPFVPVWREFWTANVTFTLDYGRYSMSDRVTNGILIDPRVVLPVLPVWMAAVAGAIRTTVGALAVPSRWVGVC